MKHETEPVEHIEKPWGSEAVFADTPEYCGKILTLACGAGTSIHMHERKDETLYVLSGRVYVEIFRGRRDFGKWDATLEDIIPLSRNCRIRLYAGTWHRVRWAGPGVDGITQVVEASTARDERGTVRIEDSRLPPLDPEPALATVESIEAWRRAREEARRGG